MQPLSVRSLHHPILFLPCVDRPPRRGGRSSWTWLSGVWVHLGVHVFLVSPVVVGNQSNRDGSLPAFCGNIFVDQVHRVTVKSFGFLNPKPATLAFAANMMSPSGPGRAMVVAADSASTGAGHWFMYGDRRLTLLDLTPHQRGRRVPRWLFRVDGTGLNAARAPHQHR